MKREEQLFTQSTTSDYFFVSERTHVKIINAEKIRGIYRFYIEWKNSGQVHNKYLSIENIRYIVRAHEIWLGLASHSYTEWKCALCDTITKEEQMRKVGI